MSTSITNLLDNPLFIKQREKNFRRKYEPILDEEKHKEKSESNRRYREKNAEKNKESYRNWKEKNTTYKQEKKNRDQIDKYGMINPYDGEDKKTSMFERMWRKNLASEYPHLKHEYNIRPDWLKNPRTDKNLEIDIFYPDAKLAIEVSCKQHYSYTPYFHKSYSDFEYQQYRDRIKRECVKRTI